MSRKIALVATNGVEEVEFTEPRDAINKAGGEALLVSPVDEVQSLNGDIKPSSIYKADLPVSKANPDDFDGLVLPGGTVNADTLRIEKESLAFIKSFVDAGKPIATICHGAWALVELNVLEGRTLTSYPSVKTDIERAGGHWVDQEYVVDGTLASSRNPNDLPAFNKGIVTLFGLD